MFIFYFFALIQSYFAYKSLRGGIDYLNYFKKEISKPKSSYQPFISIIIPCRGIDKDLEKNLEKLFLQNYPNYELIFVVDDEKDEALSVIKKVVENQSKDTKIVIAGKAFESGQKVHNLRKAILEVSDKSEVFVFVDSDARPAKNWLKNLVTPLEDSEIGCTTGYRWFIQKSFSFSTHLRSVWNASIASALGKNMDGNFCWGGSTAIRRETFEKLNIREKWKGTLSDDFALSNALKEVKMPIYFVPQCLTATVENCNFRELIEFTTRQMKITRVYSPNHFLISIIGSVLFVFTFWTGMLLLFFLSGIYFWITLAFVLLVFILGVGKAWIRLNAVKLVLKEYEKELRKQFLPQILLWTISPVLFLYNDIAALFSRKITWRGIRYNLKSANKTIIEKADG